MTHLAFEDAPQTHEARQVEKDNGVTCCKADVESPTIVPVDDPRVAADEGLYGGAPLVRRRGLPPAPPVEPVEVTEGKSSALRQPPGDGGFARSAGPDHENTFQSCTA